MTQSTTLVISDNTSDKNILYVIYFLYIVSAALPVDGNSINYAIHIVMFSVLAVYLFLFREIYNFQYNAVVILLCILLLFVAFLPPVHIETLYFRFFIIKIVLLMLLMSTISMSVQEFSIITNVSYLVFLSLSVLVWLRLIPGYDYGHVNSFMVNVGGMRWETLYGINGSTAGMDAYSGVIFLWNLLIYKGRFKKFFMAVSFFALLLTFRNTPVLALLLAGVVYFFVRNKVIGVTSLLSLIVGFLSVIWILYFSSDELVPFLKSDTTWNEFFWHATHARSSLWVQQFVIFLNDYVWSDYIVGPDLKNMTVSFVRPDGRILHETFNPHNSYLIALYRSSIAFVILFILFLFYTAKTFNRKTFPIIFFIAISAITNSSLLGLENPTFILIMLFIFTYDKFRNGCKRAVLC